MYVFVFFLGTEILQNDATDTNIMELREILYKIAQEIGGDESDPSIAELQRLLLVTHISGMAIMAAKVGLKRIAAKAKVSLLRYIGLIPIDKAFCEAGQACRDVDWLNMEFVLFNRFVDVTDLIDDPTGGDIDNTDFLETDIPNPFEVCMNHSSQLCLRRDTALMLMHTIVGSIAH